MKKKENKRKRMRKREFLSYSRDTSYTRDRKPFIGFPNGFYY